MDAEAEVSGEGGSDESTRRRLGGAKGQPISNAAAKGGKMASGAI